MVKTIPGLIPYPKKASPATYLRRAAAIITPGKRWIQGALAKTKEGGYCSPFAEEAVCFCAVGALVRASGYKYETGGTFCYGVERTNFGKAATAETPDRDIVGFNDRDGTKQKDVKAVMLKAARKLEAAARKRAKAKAKAKPAKKKPAAKKTKKTRAGKAKTAA